MDIIFENTALIISCGLNKYHFVDNALDSQNELPKENYKHFYSILETVQEKAFNGEMTDYHTIEYMLL